MADCCNVREQTNKHNDKSALCPSCKLKGKKVKLITLKSMLKPEALETLIADATHYFCSTKSCNVVYFNDKKVYNSTEIKVSVYQKGASPTSPICYCFDWTKVKIEGYVKKGLSVNPVEHIRENIKENRCGCEVNNPQGSCCLGNVTSFINEIS